METQIQEQQTTGSELVVRENKAKSTALMLKAKAFIIGNQQDYEMLAATRIALKDIGTVCETEKQKELGPLNKRRTYLLNLWKPIETEVEEADKLIEKKMIAYNAVVREKAAADQAKLEAKIEAGTIKKAETIQKHVEKIVEAQPTVYIGGRAIKEREQRVVNVIDDKLIPREYLTVDMVRVRKDALAGKVIPGVEVVTEKKLARF
jgi:hypothetical protein